MNIESEHESLRFDIALFGGVLVTLGIVISSMILKFGEKRALIFCGRDEASFWQVLLKENKVKGRFQTIAECEASYAHEDNRLYILLDFPSLNHEMPLNILIQKLVKDKSEFYYYNSHLSKEMIIIRGSHEPQVFLKSFTGLD